MKKYKVTIKFNAFTGEHPKIYRNLYYIAHKYNIKICKVKMRNYFSLRRSKIVIKVSNLIEKEQFLTEFLDSSPVYNIIIKGEKAYVIQCIYSTSKESSPTHKCG